MPPQQTDLSALWPWFYALEQDSSRRNGIRYDRHQWTIDLLDEYW